MLWNQTIIKQTYTYRDLIEYTIIKIKIIIIKISTQNLTEYEGTMLKFNSLI